MEKKNIHEILKNNIRWQSTKQLAVEMRRKFKIEQKIKFKSD
jgi:hypothetical protein